MGKRTIKSAKSPKLTSPSFPFARPDMGRAVTEAARAATTMMNALTMFKVDGSCVNEMKFQGKETSSVELRRGLKGSVGRK
jgi:hypothetical protein